MSKCKSCGQPMLSKGEVKRQGEYDHAQGCPEAPCVCWWNPETGFFEACCDEHQQQFAQEFAEGQAELAREALERKRQA